MQMRAEQQIQEMFDDFPGLFRSRKDCLSWLFCMDGNGFEWNAGQLVSKKLELSKDDAEWEYENGFDYLLGRVHATQVKPDPFAELDKLVKHNASNEPYAWHPLNKNSCIFSIPVDIKPDWKELADECISLLKADGVDYKKFCNA